jgi:hypothetical protein
VAGCRVDSGLLKRAADEHGAVVELAFEILLGRWLIRQRVQYWAHSKREPDIVRWSRGARQGDFEFTHPSVRRLLIEDVPASRRQALHGDIAAALEEIHRADPDCPCELLAWHYTAAGVWDKAFDYLEISAARARALGARHACLEHCRQALQALDRLEAPSPGDLQGDLPGGDVERSPPPDPESPGRAGPGGPRATTRVAPTRITALGLTHRTPNGFVRLPQALEGA